MQPLLLLLLLGSGTFAGCGDNEFGPERRRPNRAPETVLASGPPDSTSGTGYKVRLYWSGADADGTVHHFDVILVDHPAADDSIATSDPNAPNRVVVVVPEPDDPRWTATSANDTLLVTRADTLRRDPTPPPGANGTEIERHNAFMRMQSFERWHTLFVRAVDNEGAADPTPDYRSFNSRNIAPTLALLPPVSTTLAEFRAPPTIVFNWEGTDPVGDGTEQLPIASRWVLLPSAKNALGEYRGLPDSLYRVSRDAWSLWRAWDTRDGSGVRAIVRNLRPATGERGVGFYLFAAQAMDEAGAVTPVFDWKTPGKNNAVAIFVTGDVGPALTLRDAFLGTFRFTGVSRPIQIDVAAGQPLRFCWAGDASSYGGSIVAYRYGWNLRNLDDDASWDQNWSETATCAPARIFNSGTHTFYLETRDNAESVTRAQIQLIVRQVTRSRDLLIVDDTTHPQGDTDPGEATEDRRWLAVLDSLRADRPFTFDPVRDVYDVRERNKLPPPINLVFDYKTIVWNVISSTRGSALGDLALFADPFVEGQNSARGFNYLNIYVDNGGELWISGQQPSFVLWPLVDGRPLEEIVPANLTNWNLEVHPAEDSVGTGSLLYRMGIEAVDQASGGFVPAPRFDRMEHGSVGFRRGGGAGGGDQRTRSSVVLDHVHNVTIPGEDVDRPPPAGATYTTDVQAGHAHTLRLGAAELLRLRRGDVIEAETDAEALPTPHTHLFRLRDQVGTWGAPAFLEPDASWALPPILINPHRSRVNIEIYNMPSYLARQTPPLAPPPGRVLALFELASATPANPETGLLYPLTADGQPAFVLAKTSDIAPQYTRAYCGFEPWRLSYRSHLLLARFVLLRHLQLGLVGTP